MSDGGRSSAPQPPEKPDELLREVARLRGDLRTLATRINHDLHTPLGGIIFSLDVLKQTLPADDREAGEAMNAIRNSIEELSRLIKRVSFVTKASVSGQPREKVDMGRAVARALETLESRTLKLGATIKTPPDWPEVNGVLAWLEIIWWNLIANALQHGGPATRIELGWDKKGGEIRFWVSDNGPGVPANRRNKLFHRFDALHESDSSGGLGLSIVQRLVDLQGGYYGYETNPGGGAYFFFVLPV